MAAVLQQQNAAEHVHLPVHEQQLVQCVAAVWDQSSVHRCCSSQHAMRLLCLSLFEVSHGLVETARRRVLETTSVALLI